MALRLGTLGRATHHQQVLCEKAWQVCKLPQLKIPYGWCKMSVGTSWNLPFSTPDSACTEHTSSQQQVAGMQLCSSDVVFNFLLIAKMQQHDSAREPGLHFAASPNTPRRVQYVLKLSLSSCVNFILRRWKNFLVANQGTVQQSESTIFLSCFSLDLAVKVCGERSQFLCYMNLSFSSNP